MAARAHSHRRWHFETQRGNWSRAGRRLPVCRARGDAVCKPWIREPCDMSTLFIHVWEMRLQQSMGVCLSLSLASRTTYAAGRRRLHLRQRNLAPPSCTRHAQLRAAGLLLVAHHTSIDRCCASNDGRGGDGNGVAMPAASLSHSRGVDTVHAELEIYHL
jgi:hypothetical protein